MIIVHPNIDSPIELDGESAFELVIENRLFFYNIIEDIANQISGNSGKSVLSENNTPIEWSKKAEMIFDFIPFEINKKTLLTKIIQAIEKESLDSYNFEKTQAFIQNIEKFIQEICLEMPFEYKFGKMSFTNILKSTGFELDFENCDNLEKILTYMDLIEEFDTQKVFIFVNMRTYFDDDKISLFVKTALGHNHSILLIESTERPKINLTKRLTIDSDLCEF